MFGMTAFVTSAVLLAGLFGLRHVEMNRGARFVPRFRRILDDLALLFVEYVFKKFPHYVTYVTKTVLLHTTHFVSVVMLMIVRFFESKLHRLVHRIHGKKRDHQKTEASSYFRDVKAHKEEVSKTIDELEERL